MVKIDKFEKNSVFTYLLWLVLISAILSSLFTESKAEYIEKGAKLVQITDDGKSTLMSVSPDGKKILYLLEIAGTQKQLVVIDSDGSNRRAISPVGSPIFGEWSFGSNKIAYIFSNADSLQSQTQFYLYDLSTNKTQTISPPYIQDDVDLDDGPVFSPDDKYIAYAVHLSSSDTRQLWIYEVDSGKRWQLIPSRGNIKDIHWSLSLPYRITMKLEATNNYYDIATIDPYGKDLKLITNIGAQSIYTLRPKFSPDGKLVVYGDSTYMTQVERDDQHEDLWIANSDGTNVINITKASSPSTEKQLNFSRFAWSWDSKLIFAKGSHYDQLGNSLSSIFLIDPYSQTYETIITSNPQGTGIYLDMNTAQWSFDSSKIAFIKVKQEVENWGTDKIVKNQHWILCVYLVKEKRFVDLLIYDEQGDRKQLLGQMDRLRIEDISWAPDNKSIFITIAEVISLDEGLIKPDIYRLDLPKRLISPKADKYVGPSNLWDTSKLVKTDSQDVTETTAQSAKRIPYGEVDSQGNITQVIEPMHMTVSEAMESLPSKYDQFITINSSRNMMLFKGPADILAEFHSDLDLIDTDPPHIIVDLLAVELSEQANRNLGLDWTYAEGHFGLYQPSGDWIQSFSRSTDEAGLPSGALDTLNFVSGVGQSFYNGVGTFPREFYIRLNTLVKDGEGSILANPRAVATSGKESLIQIRKTLNYFFNEGFDTSGRPVVKKSDINADTEGRITPTLLKDGRIHMLVDISVGSFTFATEGGLPERTDRKSTTEVTVEQGQTIVIGGLRQQETSKTVTKVPLLGDLPFLGVLFKNEEEQVQNSVLTIFITPRLLKPGQKAPEWPQLDPDEHRIVPIMKNTLSPSNNGNNHKKRQLEDDE